MIIRNIPNRELAIQIKQVLAKGKVIDTKCYKLVKSRENWYTLYLYSPREKVAISSSRKWINQITEELG